MSDLSDDDRQVSYSLQTFCERAQNLRESDPATFVKFVLTGIEEDGAQAVIDPILNAAMDPESICISRDYDSLIGIAPDIMILSPITVFPLARNEDVLRTDVHLSYDFKVERDGVLTTLKLRIHEVPNICIGKWDMHDSLRIMIPALYETNRTSILTQAEQQTFYNDGLRPAVEDIFPDGSAEWPITYAALMDSQRKKNGLFSFQTKTIPSELVVELADKIREHLTENGHDWACGLVVLHQIRGVKHSNRHEAYDEHPRAYLFRFLEQNALIPRGSQSLDSLYSAPENKWWCDVAIELSSSDGLCVQWRTDGHARLLQAVLGIPDRVARRITSIGSSQYTRDIASHLPAVSGFRVATGVLSEGPHGVKYTHGYTTDKAIVYNPENGHYSKYVTGREVLDGVKGSNYCNTLYGLFLGATEKNYSAARLEVRVPLHNAAEMFHEIGVEDVQNALLTFDRLTWWSFRAYRCLALKFVIDWQAAGEPKFRIADPALLLTTATVWLLNSIHSTPDVGASSKDLLNAILPHIDREGADPDIIAYGKPTEDSNPRGGYDSDSDSRPRRRAGSGSPTVPSFPHGVVFLRPIRAGPSNPVPRFQSDVLPLKDSTYRYFFKGSPQTLLGVMNTSAITMENGTTRISNKIATTAIYATPRTASPLPVLFDLHLRGFELEPPIVDSGSDIEMEDENVDDDDDDVPFRLPPDPDIDDELTLLWRQFLLDITARSPNIGSHAEGAYCILNRFERAHVNDDTYKNHRLSAYFRDCQWIIANDRNHYWAKNFDFFFPEKDRVLPPGVQNYRQCRFYAMWREMKARANEACIVEMRKALFERFDDLYWFPRAASDRIWTSKVEKKARGKKALYQKSSGLPMTKPSPRIVVNRVAPVW